MSGLWRCAFSAKNLIACLHQGLTIDQILMQLGEKSGRCSLSCQLADFFVEEIDSLAVQSDH